MPLTQLSRTPRLYLADEFATDEEIAHILRVAGDRDALTRQGIDTKHDTTGFSFEMPVPGDACLEAYAARIHAAVGMTNDIGGSLRFRRYRIGESHPPHLDCYRIGESCLVATALLYLNDTEAGGETTFPRALPAPVAVRPAEGATGRLVQLLSERHGGPGGLARVDAGDGRGEGDADGIHLSADRGRGRAGTFCGGDGAGGGGVRWRSTV